MAPSLSNSSKRVSCVNTVAQCGNRAKSLNGASSASGVSTGDTNSVTWKSAPAAHEYGRAVTVNRSVTIAQAPANAMQYSDQGADGPSACTAINSAKVGSPLEPANWRSHSMVTEPEKMNTSILTVSCALPVSLPVSNWYFSSS